ncbi:hypothetical protein CDD82_5089 [Ophiocordyceps australis]|uniref:FHA domain-containing protein n=1 Tax=Ophiocordyceps australis TaxID=1399860 RepID=A0A2C5Z2R4_9HYPO|nr:hypothetical protein CDD82_5089 [Ophiocordyceps australis]
MKMACFDDQAEVVLAPVASHLSEPLSRHIVLDRENPTVTIGRTTSKTGAEYKQSVDNAWINCPVISREHAQITFDLGSKALTIMDLGSLHGTFRNGERLVSKEPQRLEQEDILKFGIVINKNDKLFLPYTMKASFRFGTEPRVATLPRTFRVPDSDDGEDDIYAADDSVHKSVTTLLDKGFHPAQLASATPGPRSDVIDLTIDSKESEDVSPVTNHNQDTDSDQDDMSSLFIRDGFIATGSSAASASDCGDCEIPSSPPDNDHSRSMISDAQILASFSSSSASGASVAEKMGATFGKPEYFSARYRNKCMPESPSDSESESPRSHDCSSVVPQQVARADNAIDDAAMEQVPTYGLLASGDNFLKSPQRDSSRPPAAVPIELDDTSAFQFEMSKKAMSRAIETMLGASSSHNDQVTDTPALDEEADAEPLQRKRKIDDISELTHDETAALEVDKTVKEAIQSIGDSAENLDIEQPTSKVSEPEPKAPAAMQASTSHEVSGAVKEAPRPTKRLRKAAEIFSYAALGGVAVMSALIATAPDL